MAFEIEFNNWLQDALQQEIPTSVRAFSFNLFEYPEKEEAKFGVELVGTKTFNESDPDWACDEIWEPKQRKLEISILFSGGDWKQCQAKVKSLAVEFLRNGPGAGILKSRQGVGIGFVDGDMEVIWQS